MADLIALEWFRDRIDILGPTGQSATLSTVDHADLRAPAVQAAEELKAAMVHQGIAPGKTVVILPRDAVVIRRLQVPAVGENELPDLVRFQAATKSATPIDALALDYIQLTSQSEASGLDVETVTIERETLNRIVAVCTGAGLEIVQVTLASLTLANFLRRHGFADLGQGDPDLVIEQRGEEFELSVFDQGSLAFSHSTRLSVEENPELGRAINAEITRTLMALSQLHPSANVLRCLYLPEESNPQILETLEKRFGAGLKNIAPGELNHQVPAGFEALAGAQTLKDDAAHRINLLHPRQKTVAPDRRKFYAAMAAMALLGCGLLAAWWYYGEKGELAQKLAEVEKEINAMKTYVNGSKPVADAHARVVKWNDGDLNVITAWSEFQKHVLDRDRAYFTEFKVLPMSNDVAARILARGQARERADTDELHHLLTGNGFRAKPITPKLEKRDPDYQQQFDLDVEIPRSLLPAQPKSHPPVPPRAAPVTKAAASK